MNDSGSPPDAAAEPAHREEPAAQPAARRGRWPRRLARAGVVLAALIVWIVAIVCLTTLAGRSAPTVTVAIVAVAAATLLWKPRRARWMLATGALLLALALVWRGALTPSNDREWWPDVAVLPTISFEGDVATIEGVRSWEWPADGGHVERWETRSYDLANLRGVDLIVQPFPYSSLMAHTMLSFDFGPQGWLTLSIEARKERREDYGPIAGALNQFELIYTFLDERDAFTLRAVQRGDELYAYPIRARPPYDGLRRFFRDLCASANRLHAEPEFYHIIYDNCTTVWIRHADAVAAAQGRDERVGLQLDTILNGRITRLFHAAGHIDTDLPFDEARERFRVDELVRAHADDPEFSARIRADRSTPPS